jgi:divinyl protochlorophyllide a 8-vinyl-reductase
MTTLVHPAAGARIGPNAIIQVACVLRDRLGKAFADRLLRDTTPYTCDALPHEMVDESEARAVVQGLVDRVGERAALGVLREAGARTADYLLANRIPQVAQALIRLAPRRLGLRWLLAAMRANAWTFAGSGEFRVTQTDADATLTFERCAMCTGMHAAQPMCDFYAGTFERLIRVLVTPGARVREEECLATGGSVCRFRVRLSGPA